MSGEAIKSILEDVCDNLFNPDPYYQQGGDMVRVGGMQLPLRSDAENRGTHQRHDACAASRSRPAKHYKVASWAPVAEGASGEPVWEVVARYLRAKKVVRPVRPNRPELIGVRGNPGIS